MPTRLRLHHRIVGPFALVALVAIAASAAIAVSVMARTLESRVQAQILSASEVVGRGDFALNPSILQSVKEITGADVITFTTEGAVLATTVDRDRRAGLISTVMARESVERGLASADGVPVLRLDGCGSPCYVVYRPVLGRPGTVVAFVDETSDIDAAIGAIARTVLLAAGLSFIAMLLVSQFVARRLTAPLQRLIAFTREVSSGNAQRRAPGSEDEVGRLAAAFNEMLDRLEQSQHALVRSEKLGLAGLLAARVAHDIRNPLSSIKMQAQLLTSHLRGDGDERNILASILRDVDQVESVIRNLLDVARPADLKPRPFQLNDVVRNVLQRLAPQLAHSNIDVETALDPALPLIALDVERFKDALLNVVVNALEAMPGGGALRVETRGTSGNMSVELDVCDDGVGIDPAMVDRVFDPFVSTKREGVGLGLVNAKVVVESHGGRITLVRRESKGTCTRISFPVGDLHG